MAKDHFNVGPFGADLRFSGGVMLLEDCEGTCTWIIGGTGGDDVHDFATAAAFVGTKGFQLKTRTTGEAIGDTITATKRMGYPFSGLMVVRARCCVVAEIKVKELTLKVVVGNGTRYYYAGLIWYPATRVGKYLDAAGAEQTITEFDRRGGQLTWLTFEMVVDCKAMQYISLGLGGARKDMAGIDLQDVGANTQIVSSIELSHKAATNFAAEVYWDCIYAGEFLEV